MRLHPTMVPIWSARAMGLAAVLLFGVLSARAVATAQSPDVCAFPGSDEAKIDAFLGAGCYKDWPHDAEVRRTGPIIDGVDFFTHGRARVYYSPEVYA